MEYWDVVVVITALIGLIVTVTKPIIALSSKITELITKLDKLEKNMEDNNKEHVDIRTRLNEDEATIAEHETRISVLEANKP